MGWLRLDPSCPNRLHIYNPRYQRPNCAPRHPLCTRLSSHIRSYALWQGLFAAIKIGQSFRTTTATMQKSRLTGSCRSLSHHCKPHHWFHGVAARKWHPEEGQNGCRRTVGCVQRCEHRLRVCLSRVLRKWSGYPGNLRCVKPRFTIWVCYAGMNGCTHRMELSTRKIRWPAIDYTFVSSLLQSCLIPDKRIYPFAMIFSIPDLPADRYQCAKDSLKMDVKVISSSSTIAHTRVVTDAEPPDNSGEEYRRIVDMWLSCLKVTEVLLQARIQNTVWWYWGLQTNKIECCTVCWGTRSGTDEWVRHRWVTLACCCCNIVDSCIVFEYHDCIWCVCCP